MKIRSNHDGLIMLPRGDRLNNRGNSHMKLSKGDEAEVGRDNPSFRMWLAHGLILPADKESEKLLAELKKE